MPATKGSAATASVCADRKGEAIQAAGSRLLTAAATHCSTARLGCCAGKKQEEVCICCVYAPVHRPTVQQVLRLAAALGLAPLAAA